LLNITRSQAVARIADRTHSRLSSN